MNKEKTIEAILNKINSTVGMSINIQKFNQKKNDEQFLRDAAKFVGVQVVEK